MANKRKAEKAATGVKKKRTKLTEEGKSEESQPAMTTRTSVGALPRVNYTRKQPLSITTYSASSSAPVRDFRTPATSVSTVGGQNMKVS